MLTMCRSLYFFSVNKGKIISSRHGELYRTFRELYKPRYPTDAAHRSDAWLVDKLWKHYSIIRSRGQRSFLDLTSMRTIGLAIFIRVCCVSEDLKNPPSLDSLIGP